MLMFSELQNKVWGEKRTDADGKPVFDFETGIKFLQSDGRDEIHISADLSVFKCKPTTLDLPPQILITFNPPISLSNNMFSNLRVIRERGEEEVRFVKHSLFTYLYERSLESPPKPDEKERYESEEAKGLDRFRYVLRNDDDTYLTSGFDYLYTESTRKEFYVTDANLVQRYADDDDIVKSVKVLEFEAAPQRSIDNQYENFELRDKIVDQVHSVNIKIYTPFTVINKTNIPLILGKKHKK